jgi:hypothetical protein
MQSWKIEKFSEPGGTTDLPTVTKVTKRVMTDLTIMILFLIIMIGSFVEFYFSTGSQAQSGIDGIVASISSVVFWTYLAGVLIMFPLKKGAKEALHLIRNKLWAAVLFIGYLSIHLVIYGVLLELMLATIYQLKLPAGGPPILIYLTGNYAYSPHTLLAALETISLNPSVSVLFPFELGVVLGPFSIVLAIIIGLLVVGNVSRLMKISGTVKKLGLSIALPAVGVAGGASCCISIPALLAIASPAVYSFLILPVGILVQNALYFGLPILVVMVLALNYRSLVTACPT